MARPAIREMRSPPFATAGPHRARWPKPNRKASRPCGRAWTDPAKAGVRSGSIERDGRGEADSRRIRKSGRPGRIRSRGRRGASRRKAERIGRLRGTAAGRGRIPRMRAFVPEAATATNAERPIRAGSGIRSVRVGFGRAVAGGLASGRRSRRIPARSARQLPGENVAQDVRDLARILRHGQRGGVDLFQGVPMLRPVKRDQRFA